MLGVGAGGSSSILRSACTSVLRLGWRDHTALGPGPQHGEPLLQLVDLLQSRLLGGNKQVVVIKLLT